MEENFPTTETTSTPIAIKKIAKIMSWIKFGAVKIHDFQRAAQFLT